MDGFEACNDNVLEMPMQPEINWFSLGKGASSDRVRGFFQLRCRASSGSSPATSFARGTLLACSRWPEAVRRGRLEASLKLTRRPQRPACSGLIQTVRTAGPPEATSSCQCTCLHSQISQKSHGQGHDLEEECDTTLPASGRCSEE